MTSKTTLTYQVYVAPIIAASVDPLDWHFMRGTPYVVRAAGGLSRPKAKGLGADMAGQVEAVGKDVTEFRPGDEVFGSRSGTFAEYVSIPEVCLRGSAGRAMHHGDGPRCRTSTVSEEMACPSCSR